MEIVFTDGHDERFIGLCQELDGYLAFVFGAEKQRKQYARHNTLEHIHDVALIIENGEAVACGAFKEYDSGTAEVKRVFTKEGYRNRGYARAIMRALEARALHQGYTRLILETGFLLQAAQRMYAQIGFHITPNYGQYTDMPESVCMEKQLVCPG